MFTSYSILLSIKWFIICLFYSPMIVAMRCLLPPPSLNSHRYILCQVPRFSLLFVIGIVSETPTILDLAWADISVGPSSWCRYLGSPSGTNLSKIPFKSYRTSGSKFSLSDNPQLVCLTKRFSIPVFGSAGY